MAELRQQAADSSALILILTAARTGEVIGAQWKWFNLAERLWIVPGERMKAGKEHRVPLSDAAMAIVEAMSGDRTDGGGSYSPVARKPARCRKWPC